MAYENIQLQNEGGIGLLTINRPKALNALNRATLLELNRVLEDLEQDTSLRALIVTGAGEKAFIAGADISEMVDFTVPEALAFSQLGHRVANRFEALPVPVIAGVNGFALGGGCELAMACDLIVASERARFGQPEVGLGVLPGFGGTSRLVRCIGVQRARELIYTGDTLDAQGALALGLVIAVVPPDQLLVRCRDIAQRIAQRGSLAVAQAKRVIRAGADLPVDAANSLEVQAFAALFGSKDQKEGMRAFIEKRPAKFIGA